MKALAIFSAAAIVAMPGCSASSGSGGSSPASGGGGGGASSQAASGPGIGSKVRDGKFQFTITRVSHRASVGNTTLGLGTKAQGRFTELHLKVTNIGSESQTLDDSSQYVFDANGRKFSADSSADIEVNSVRALILFDLPKGDKAVKAELHDSPFSGGVTVRLGS